MNDQDIFTLWKSQDQKIEAIMAINAKLLKDQISQKAKKALGGLKAEKITGIVFGSVYLVILGALVSLGVMSGNFSGNYFLWSVTAIFLINLKIFSDYIRHLVMSLKIDFSGPVAEIQPQLIELRLSLIRSVGYVGLQLPFYSTLHLHSSWFPDQANLAGIIIQSVITLSFTAVAIWIFVKFRPENSNQKTVKWLMSLAGIKEVDRSLAQLEELNQLELSN
ncbi:hypothetical protein ACFOSV_05955 [Algoriphagus namhaensis]|uniref:Uncharacterized protein n=1 Tax=Algoriphagus namhaensis TaxID=915353 RepID=A0ABV8AP19_9BACT